MLFIPRRHGLYLKVLLASHKSVLFDLNRIWSRSHENCPVQREAQLRFLGS
jgi:hypothetical protein